jgi:MGT family glycosyltransferase
MKVLIASTPATGHINPMFAIGRMLVEEGHQVVGLSANAMRDRIEAAGATFHPFPKEADLDLRYLDAIFPEIKTIAPGPDMSRFYMERVFVDPMPAQYEGVKQVLKNFPADVILGDNGFLGALPMLLGPRSNRPPIVICGTMFLTYRRDDGAPHFMGLLPARDEAEHAEYAAIAKTHEELLYAPVRQYRNDCLARMHVGPLAGDSHEAMITLPDAWLQLTIPNFEFPRQYLPPTVHFVGALPIIPNQAPLPPWAAELDGTRKVVLATQGTVSNHDFNQLIVPTLAALANEPDVLVVVTTGGRPLGDIPAAAIPVNARLANYLPFEWLLPKVDVLVTNGGFGTVNQALSFGIPLVTAGLSEDKADVNARVAWSGVGIDLKTQNATSSAVREAVRTVLDKPSYRSRAAAMANEFSAIDTRGEILSILEQLSRAEDRPAGGRPAIFSVRSN